MIPGSVPRRLERLIDALAEDLIGAAEGEVLASHAPGAARAAATALRSALRRAASGMAEPPAAPMSTAWPADAKARGRGDPG